MTLEKVPGFRSDTVWKKIVASSVYILIFLLIVAAIMGPSEDSPSTSTPEGSSVQETIDKEPAEMLPAPEQLPTEFSPFQVRKSNITYSGFESLAGSGYDKAEGSRGWTDVKFTVYKFEDAEAAQDFYINVTDGVRERRGYTELSAPSNCFQYVDADRSYEYRYGNSYCVESNIVYQTSVTQTDVFRDGVEGYLEDMSEVLESNVN